MHTVSDKTEDAILVVSFGTSYNDNREKTIGAIETAIADAFPKVDGSKSFYKPNDYPEAKRKRWL